MVTLKGSILYGQAGMLMNMPGYGSQDQQETLAPMTLGSRPINGEFQKPEYLAGLV